MKQQRESLSPYIMVVTLDGEEWLIHVKETPPPNEITDEVFLQNDGYYYKLERAHIEGKDQALLYRYKNRKWRHVFAGPIIGYHQCLEFFQHPECWEIMRRKHRWIAYKALIAMVLLVLFGIIFQNC